MSVGQIDAVFTATATGDRERIIATFTIGSDQIPSRESTGPRPSTESRSSGGTGRHRRHDRDRDRRRASPSPPFQPCLQALTELGTPATARTCGQVCPDRFAGSRYPSNMATTRQTHLQSALPTRESVHAARSALLATRANRDAAELERRVQVIRRAAEGRRLGVPLTPDLYR
jgi:hypothetical protein